MMESVRMGMATSPGPPHAIERHRMQAETELMRTQQLQLKDEQTATGGFHVYRLSQLSDPISRGTNQSMESFVEHVSAGIQDHIDTKCLQGIL
jgi:hypothetical protein